MKIMSVEDIERNIRNQQLQQKSDSTGKPSTPLPNLQRRQPNNMVIYTDCCQFIYSTEAEFLNSKKCLFGFLF